MPTNGNEPLHSKTRPQADGSRDPATLNGDAAPAEGENELLLGDGRGGTIEVDCRLHVPAGPNARTRRKEEFPELVRHALRKAAERDGAPPVTDADVEREVARQLEAAAARRLDVEAALGEVAPELGTRPASEVDRQVELAAVMRLPAMVWAMFRLILHGRGPKEMPMWRRLAVAVAMHMGFACVRPNACRVLEHFCKRDTVLAWSHLWPGEPPNYRDPETGRWERSAFHKQLKKVLSTRNPHGMWQAINRELLLQLLGEHTVDERKGGRFERVPDALKYILVDGFLIEANLPQNKPVSEAHARMVRGENRARCGFVVYKKGDGQVTRKCHGYKWLQLSLLKAGGLVIEGELFPANVNEREATLHLLAKAFRRWPELSLQKDIVLVGDALYDQHEQFAYDLIFRWGIHPCFPRAGTVTGETTKTSRRGVPICGCGELAMLQEADKFPTPWYRHKNELPGPGQYIFDRQGEVVDNARLRWRCANKNKNQRCSGVPDTYPRENPRLYTYLPHAGNHRRAALRTALGAYRNVVESTFSVMKDMHLAGKAQDRPQWAGDDQMDHLVWMTVVTMTARALVHENGLYRQVYDEAHSDGLLKAPTLTDRQALPDMSVADAQAWRAALMRYAKAPADCPELDPVTEEFHGFFEGLAA